MRKETNLVSESSNLFSFFLKYLLFLGKEVKIRILFLLTIK